ncbi:hypothetical protein KSP39_PZI007574 [Platanthera zijinensis]|uniref:Uncharacterized protein n=1 Tax=Platanthera zijinensis TaxID=2320716 RepID=A0AAP0G8Y2_9ASPA
MVSKMCKLSEPNDRSDPSIILTTVKFTTPCRLYFEFQIAAAIPLPINHFQISRSAPKALASLPLGHHDLLTPPLPQSPNVAASAISASPISSLPHFLTPALLHDSILQLSTHYASLFANTDANADVDHKPSRFPSKLGPAG